MTIKTTKLLLWITLALYVAAILTNFTIGKYATPDWFKSILIITAAVLASRLWKAYLPHQ